MKIAVAQLCSTPSITHNIERCLRLIRRAAAANAKLVYLPEAADYIAPTNTVYDLAAQLPDHVFVQRIKMEARSSRIWVGVGVHERPETPLSSERRVFNTHLLIDDTGDIKGRYEKLHLFDVDLKGSGGSTFLESASTVPGRNMTPPVKTPAGQVGLLTCYDIRFAEPALLLRQRGAHILTYPSAFTIKTGKAHWETLLRARAIETQSYVLAPAQAGEHFAGRFSYGRAMIVDPWGTILAQCKEFDNSANSQPEVNSSGEEDDLAIAEIDLDYLTQVRREMPLWDQRRADVYNLSERYQA
ncbi:probable NIT2-nitrilase [Serendipita indica DSM 11827]|uniref:Probable NIT2-nitrilase n=1 Tax=Serendipita indica (strain DSM 11827) TaxID=1109443 RepID=G4TNZ5_SERID|nr:probable NIT2-nitrilase [Serendipita indica DSM 11827]